MMMINTGTEDGGDDNDYNIWEWWRSGDENKPIPEREDSFLHCAFEKLFAYISLISMMY